MFSEILLVVSIGVAGTAIACGVFFLLMGKNISTRLLIGLIPGITLLILLIYMWQRTGGIGSFKTTLWAVPVGIGFFVVNLGLMSRRLIKPLGSGMWDLRKSAERISSASEEILVAGQQLAEGASEQAAAIEETSASLEEMSSMTRQNASHASTADTLSSQTKTTTDSCSNTMQEMAAAIGQVSDASQETRKIVKTIDEIAFQTNLLALNAAVEAARAGEAGAGFAVVADEVRNLALRAATAAKDTTEQIDNINSKIEEAMDLVFETIDAFSSVDENTGKMNVLMSEISSGSNEQAQGIEQINRAVTEMDKVVQQNAASAEESAAATEEMNAQTGKMMDRINGLLTLLGSGAGKSTDTQKPVELPSEMKRPRLAEISRGDARDDLTVVPTEPRNGIHERKHLGDF